MIPHQHTQTEYPIFSEVEECDWCLGSRWVLKTDEDGNPYEEGCPLCNPHGVE